MVAPGEGERRGPVKPLTSEQVYWTNQQNLLWHLMAQNRQITTGLLYVVQNQEKHTERNALVLEKLAEAVACLAGTVETQAEEAASPPKPAPRSAPFSIIKPKKTEEA